MPRYRLTVEYDGRPFQGWQRQATGPTVQEALETALAAIFGQPVEVVGAGRTDAGVHAAGQVAHADLPRPLPPGRLVAALNAHLRPQPVTVLQASEVPANFHARFSACRRHYRYEILNRRSPPALAFGRVWHVPVPLDAELMHIAAQQLVGRHDFTSFRASECQAADPVKTLQRLTVARDGEQVTLRCMAPSFLHHQVRNMAGTLKLVGQGKLGIAAVAEILRARDRAAAGPTAPADGLVLVAVDYPPAALTFSGTDERL